MPLTQRQKDAIKNALVAGNVFDAASANAFIAAIGNVNAPAPAARSALSSARNPNIDDLSPACASSGDGSWEETKADGYKVPILTAAAVELFFKNTLKLENSHINILRQ